METINTFDFTKTLSYLGAAIELVSFEHIDDDYTLSTRDFYGTRDDVILSAGNYAVVWDDCDFAQDLIDKFPCKKIEIDEQYAGGYLYVFKLS